ncbi:MAG: hypothetical protein ACRD3G_27130, partial [Vicinamibacterales bacterium]
LRGAYVAKGAGLCGDGYRVAVALGIGTRSGSVLCAGVGFHVRHELGTLRLHLERRTPNT